MSKKLARLEIDEAKRAVSGMSGWRKCLVYQDYLQQLEVEGRFSEVQGSARVLAAMKHDGIDTETAGFKETVGRYQC